MIEDFSTNEYFQLLKARLGKCTSIVDARIAHRIVVPNEVLILKRGGEPGNFFENDALADTPLDLVGGGTIDLDVKIRRSQLRRKLVVEDYCIRIMNIPENENDITSLRYDVSRDRGQDFDEVLQDNPVHPMFHLHVNFEQGAEARALRLPTAKVCPISVLINFDRWYQTNVV
jgi:hypothetical protein